MSAALIVAMCFTGALILATAYFLMGSVPLLLLKHDTPMDARFVRGFFDIYYRAAMFTAGAAAVGYGFGGQPAFAGGTAVLAVLAAVLRRTLIPAMGARRHQIEAGHLPAIGAFRRLHVVAVLVNLLQLVVLVGCLIAVSMQLKAGA